jgi:hypothetical protein
MTRKTVARRESRHSLTRYTLADPSDPTATMNNWRHWPETRLLRLALPIETLWEIVQFPLYTVWHERGWGYILYSLVHCTAGDLLILLVCYEFVALMNRTRHWYRERALGNGLLFTVLGAAYTVFSERYNVGVAGN